jgi:hypothetical protein
MKTTQIKTRQKRLVVIGFMGFIVLFGNTALQASNPPATTPPQTKIKYEYDPSGNRTSRKTIVLSSPAPAQHAAQDTVAKTYEETIDDAKIVIYPNPTYGQLQVEITTQNIPAGARIYLYSMTGSLVRQWGGITQLNTMDISAQPAGVYIMRIVLDDKRTSVWNIIKH